MEVQTIQLVTLAYTMHKRAVIKGFICADKFVDVRAAIQFRERPHIYVFNPTAPENIIKV